MHVAFFFFLVSLHLLEIFPVTLTSLGARAFAGSLTVFTLGTFSVFVMGRFFALISGGK